MLYSWRIVQTIVSTLQVLQVQVAIASVGPFNEFKVELLSSITIESRMDQAANSGLSEPLDLVKLALGE
jgi:hypothetical protein